MRVPLSWLAEFAPFELAPAALGEVFDDLGMVVEGIETVGDDLAGVVVARVLEVAAHPDADRVRLTQVDAGDGQPRQVVCGAPNVAAGQLVPLATAGAVLPGGLAIARRKVRGQWSEGMICSPAELGVGDDGAGILVLPEGPAPGTPARHVLGGAEVVFDLAIEANRPDALSVAGVARDAAARLGLPFALPEPASAPVAGTGRAAAELPLALRRVRHAADVPGCCHQVVVAGHDRPDLLERQQLARRGPTAAG